MNFSLGDLDEGLQKASPMLLALGQQMMAPPDRRDPRALTQAQGAMQQRQAREQAQIQRQAAIEQARRSISSVATGPDGLDPRQAALASAQAGIDPAAALGAAMQGLPDPGLSQQRQSAQDAIEMAMQSGGIDPARAAVLRAQAGINPQAGLAAAAQGMGDPASRDLDYARLDLQRDALGLDRERLVAQRRMQAMQMEQAQQEAMAPDIKGEGAIRKEWTGITKDFREVDQSFSQIRKLASKPTPANDLALIYRYMKMLDPGSTVMAGEFENAEQAGSWMESRGLSFSSVARVWRGEKLSESQRADFLRSAQAMHAEAGSMFGEMRNQYTGIAQSYGYDPDRAVPDFGLFKNSRQSSSRSGPIIGQPAWAGGAGGEGGGEEMGGPEAPVFDGNPEGLPVGAILQGPNGERVRWDGSRMVPVE